MAKNAVPKYRRHRKPSGDRAYVELDGQRIQLGPYDSPESRERYARLIAEWEASGRQPFAEKDTITVVELVARFWSHAEAWYRRPDGTVTRELGNFRSTLKPLLELYGTTSARDFGPRAFKAVRDEFIRNGACRNYVNQAMGRLKRVFRWAIAEELLSPTVHQSLQAVPGLRRGRSEARESEPIRPVSDEHVRAVQTHVSAQVWAIIQLQLLSSARSGELVALRPCDLDTTGTVWTSTPGQHKTAHHGHARTIYFGPRAQEVLRPFLLGRAPGMPCFSPREAEEKRRQDLNEKRVTPLSCGNAPGRHRVRRPRREPGDSYDIHSYGRAITRACKEAGIAHWHPHQLRHAAGTYLRREFGPDVAQVILGHKHLNVTEIYAELNAAKALEVVGKIG